ncbi:sugar phosphate nucleotidyltransferase, partial [Kitasatospora sp. NPDC093558]|uniref:sugar phosphate nucleotidyltransferase n=1 Tax=Kitasatospora sp. NPDC093558 TaxID=3155201 RepID=UPI00343C8D3F
MKAVVMAGGEGSRLRPMTSTAPKPLLPVAGRPIMEHVLRLLRRHGLTSTVVTVQYLAEQIEDEFGDGTQLGMRLSYVREREPLGTAGCVGNARQELADGPFLVISGDALTDIDLGALIRFHRDKDALVTVCLTRVPDPVEFGITIVDDQGRVERFLEKPTWSQVFSDTVNTGIYVVEPEVLDLIPEGEAVDWSADVFPRILADGGIYGFVADGYWQDVGTHESYLTAQSDVLEGRVGVERAGFELAPGVWVDATAHVDPGAVLRGPLHVGAHARIGPGAQILDNTVIGDHAVVERDAVVHRAVVHPHAYLGPRARLRGCVLGRNATVHADARIGEHAVIGEGSVLEERSVVGDRVMVYPHKTVEAGAVVNRSLLWQNRAARSVFGSRGVRGVLGTDITPEVVVQLAGAFATMLPRGATATVACDHSRGARVLTPSVLSALQAGGVHVRDLGCVPVPLARMETAAGADGGILVLAEPGDGDAVSVVLLDAQGFDLSQSAQRALDRVYGRREYRRALAGETGELDRTAVPMDWYGTALVRAAAAAGRPGTRGARLKVVVDAAHGSASLILPQVLGRLDVDALLVNSGLDPDRAAETPRDKNAALHELGTVVRAAGAAFGVRLDATGERMSLVDEQGQVIADDIRRGVSVQPGDEARLGPE